MKVLTLLHRYRWSIVVIFLAVTAWWLAFRYLIDFRAPDVPFVVTPDDAVAAMLDLGEVSSADVVYDLGSGDGRILLAAARRGARAVGIEIDPELVERSRQAVRSAGFADRVIVRRADIFKEDVTEATVITMYLTPELNARLRPQLEQLHAGTRVVSHMFSIPGAKGARKITVHSPDAGMEHPIYLWVAPIEWE